MKLERGSQERRSSREEGSKQAGVRLTGGGRELAKGQRGWGVGEGKGQEAPLYLCMGNVMIKPMALHVNLKKKQLKKSLRVYFHNITILNTGNFDFWH